ncbi:reverse transcriptase domain-containing protein [Tanacetum coccineum]
MPYSGMEQSISPELTPTCMTLELANRSITKPIGIAEDVFVNVGKFQFPADFVVVDFEPDPRVPLILGRCFLKTSHALIDVYEGEITLRVGKEAITFNLDQTSKYTADYNHMTVNDKLPVIIAKDLKDEEKAALLKVLKSHKRAIAWKLSDIKGVSPEFCTHKILMEEDYEPSVQSQRRVNPKIHDVIKKEVEKLLDAGLIYPISDSPWVSPVHCVPKKGGMTVITNDENELILLDCHGMENEYYCSLDGFSAYFSDPNDPKDQEKTTFTAITELSLSSHAFWLCNAPGSSKDYLFAKKDAKARLMRWILLLQEFDIDVRDKKGAENLAADHLSRLENPHQRKFR